MNPFRFGHAAAHDWRTAATACLAQIGEIPATATLGFLYLTDLLAEHADDLLAYLREETGVVDWVGTQGLGICATGVEYYDRPALAILLGEFAPDSYRVFTIPDTDLEGFEARHGDWIRARSPYMGLVHGDPTSALIETLIQSLAQRTSAGFLVGGFTSTRGEMASIANGLTTDVLSGVLFTDQIRLATALTQGCSPIGPTHTITEAQRNILIQLDGESAFEVFKQDIGEELAEDLGRLGGYILVGLPIVGSDIGDYLARNLVGIDPKHGLLAIGEVVENGQPILFCRRDAATAIEDLDRMLNSLKRRLSGPPRGGIYVSCLGRGVNLFGPDSAELKRIQQILGDFPLVGFHANGEVSRDCVYGYTGILTLFL